MSDTIKMRPGTFVVLEGLDDTGKTTQLARLQQASEGRFGHKLFEEPRPLFTHQPSGGSTLGEAIYHLTETEDIVSPWTRQLLHLAAHCEHYLAEVLPALEAGRSVFMDRCWWSTFAYGYYAGGLWHNMNARHFLELAQQPAQGRLPDVVFYFGSPWRENPLNTEELRKGYAWLCEATLKRQLGHTQLVLVPSLSVENTTKFLFEMLAVLEMTE